MMGQPAHRVGSGRLQDRPAGGHPICVSGAFHWVWFPSGKQHGSHTQPEQTALPSTLGFSGSSLLAV